MDTNPIETHYKGCRFRSRLEARWAVFFDVLGITWEYEKEGYDLGEAGWYLPDFWLPEQKCWIEIKGQEPTRNEIDKTYEIAEHTGYVAYILCGSIPEPGSTVKTYGDAFAFPVSIDLPSNYMENLLNPSDAWLASDDWGVQLGCPICRFSYVHIEKPTHKSSGDKWGVAWEGRGDAAYIPMWCESGHSWKIRYGFHKGAIFMDVVSPTSMSHDFGLLLADMDADKRDQALAAARAARFEHGENGFYRGRNGHT